MHLKVSNLGIELGLVYIQVLLSTNAHSNFPLLHVVDTYFSHLHGATLLQNISCVFDVGNVKIYALAFSNS